MKTEDANPSGSKSLLKEKTVSIRWAANHLKISASSVGRLIESGDLMAYQIAKRGWWRVVFDSVVALEERIARDCGRKK